MLKRRDVDHLSRCLEGTTLWSFPIRGNWATHKGDYPGNWAPQIPRNLILRYTEVGDTVLDPMVGGGTTLIEAKLLGRNGIGVDINPQAIAMARTRLNFSVGPDVPRTRQLLFLWDCREMRVLRDNTVDLVTAHPPYLDIVRYGGRSARSGDLSTLTDVEDYCREIRKVARELLRVLKPGHFCAVLIGDTRRKGHYVPLAARVMYVFLKAGFVLKETAVKVEWGCSSTRRWVAKAGETNFLIIAHENLFIFRKPYLWEEVNQLYPDSIAWEVEENE